MCENAKTPFPSVNYEDTQSLTPFENDLGFIERPALKDKNTFTMASLSSAPPFLTILY
jgi:hypothetical protein